MSISVGDAILKITGDTSGVDKAIEGLEGKMGSLTDGLKTFQNAAGIASTAIVGAFSAAAFSFGTTADNLEEMNQRTGVSTTTLQEFGYAAKLSGGSLEGLEGSIKRMQVALVSATGAVTKATEDSKAAEVKVTQVYNEKILDIQETASEKKIALEKEAQKRIARLDADDKNRATKVVQIQEDLRDSLAKVQSQMANDLKKASNEKAIALTEASQQMISGSAEAQKAFVELGLSAIDLQKLKPEDQFIAIATAISEIKDPTERAAAAVSIFGRAGTDLLPMLSKGKAGLQEMRDEAHKLNAVMGEDAVKAGANFKDNMDKLKMSFEGLVNSIGIAVAGDLDKLVAKLTVIVAEVGKWIEKNPELIKTIFEIAAAVMVLVGVIKLFAVVQAIATAMTGWVGIAALLAGSIAAIAAVAGIEELLKKAGQPLLSQGTPIYGDGGKVTGYSSFAGFEGTIPGIPGTPIPAIVHAGEYIGQGKGGGDTYSFNFNNSTFLSRSGMDEFVQILSREMYKTRRLNV